MKSKDRLYQLIKSLTPAEKRYIITNSSGAGNKQKNYLKLLKEIDKQDEYNETKIKTKFKDEAFAKQLWVAKNYLYNLILKQLIQYKGESSRLGWFTLEMNKFEVLYNKGLYQEAYSLSSKLKEALVQREMFAELLILISAEIPLIKYVRKSGDLEYPRINGKLEALHYLEFLTNVTQYECIHSEFYEAFVKRMGISADQNEIFQPLLENPLLKNENKALTERSKQSLYFIKAVCGKLAGDVEQAYYYSKKLVDSSLERPETLESPNSLPLALYNHIIILFEQQHPNLQEIEYCLNILGDEKRYKKDTLRFALEKYYLASFRYVEYTTDTDKIEALIQSLASFMASNELGDAFENRSLYALGMMNFFIKDYKAAFRCTNLILNKNKNLVENDYLIFAHIMRLICAFELQLIDALPSYFRSAYRFLKNSDIESASVELLLKLIKSQFRSFTTSEKHLKDLMTSFQTFSKKDIAHFEKPYLYLSAWVSAKIHGNDFLTEYRKKNRWSN